MKKIHKECLSEHTEKEDGQGEMQHRGSGILTEALAADLQTFTSNHAACENLTMC